MLPIFTTSDAYESYNFYIDAFVSIHAIIHEIKNLKDSV